MGNKPQKLLLQICLGYFFLEFFFFPTPKMKYTFSLLLLAAMAFVEVVNAQGPVVVADPTTTTAKPADPAADPTSTTKKPADPAADPTTTTTKKPADPVVSAGGNATVVANATVVHNETNASNGTEVASPAAAGSGAATGSEAADAEDDSSAADTNKNNNLDNETNAAAPTCFWMQWIAVAIFVALKQ